MKTSAENFGSWEVNHISETGMTALIIGGDYIETLKRELLAHGLRHVEHWDGR
jgi:hypothetical protein